VTDFRLPAVSLLLGGVVMLPGCATMRHGTTQEVAIVTHPPGARCMLARGDETLPSIPATPAVVTLDRRGAALSLDCRRDGYLDARGTLDIVKAADAEAIAAVEAKAAREREAAEAKAMSPAAAAGTGALATTGALIGLSATVAAIPVIFLVAGADSLIKVGGAVGTGFDHLTGAAYAIGAVPTIELVPVSFVDDEARDRLFLRRREEATAEAARLQRGLDVTTCKTTFMNFRCDAARAQVDAALATRLA
jgi:hypothetical protein